MNRLLIIVIFAFGTASSALAQGLSISASGATSYPCSLAYEILDEEGSSLKLGFIELTSSTAKVEIDLELSSRFAVQVYEDGNRNQKLDRGFFTQPLELYGFSNDAWSPLSKPSVDEMLVNASKKSSVHIELRSVGTLK